MYSINRQPASTGASSSSPVTYSTSGVSPPAEPYFYPYLPFGLAPPPPGLLFAALRANANKNATGLTEEVGYVRPQLTSGAFRTSDMASTPRDNFFFVAQLWTRFFDFLEQRPDRQFSHLATNLTLGNTSQTQPNVEHFPSSIEQRPICDRLNAELETKNLGNHGSAAQVPAPHNTAVFTVKEPIDLDPMVTVLQLDEHSVPRVVCIRTIEQGACFGPWSCSHQYLRNIASPMVQKLSGLHRASSRRSNTYMQSGRWMCIPPWMTFLRSSQTGGRTLLERSGAHPNLAIIALPLPNKSSLPSVDITTENGRGDALQHVILVRALRTIQPGEELLLE
ncbi:unnamed protein product [Dicrocoelium dendriticum]|nr:unnamed protein product [Dicrocoelium dendriticum]